jgi:hypothetical protein
MSRVGRPSRCCQARNVAMLAAGKARRQGAGRVAAAMVRTDLYDRSMSEKWRL